MSARFEIVRTDATQPWHARFRAGNGRIVWTTENYKRRGRAVDAIALLSNWFADATEIRDVDERTPPLPPLVAEPPYYLGTMLCGSKFWHDRDYHWRFCTDDCPEGTPLAGDEIRVRFGLVEYDERAS